MIYYNKSAGSNKAKLAHATKEHCLKNTINVFGKKNITIIGDNLNTETEDIVNSLSLKLIKVTNGNGSATFRNALDLAIEENNDDNIVYLLEDDFLHLSHAKKILEEGVRLSNWYVTGYDHPDKYINKENGGNPYIESNGEVTRLIKSNSTHWKITNSTVMSFAASVKRLKQDKELLYKFSSNNITDSFGFFTELSNTKNIGCLSSVPGVSTHAEIKWLSPFTDWTTI